jgi:signal transduction histidine kinase
VLRSVRARLIIASFAVVALVLGASVVALRHLMIVSLETTPEAARPAAVAAEARALLEAGVPALVHTLESGADVAAELDALHRETGCRLFLQRDGSPLVVAPEDPDAEYELQLRGDVASVLVTRHGGPGSRDEDRFVGRPARLELASASEPRRSLGLLLAFADEVFTRWPRRPEVTAAVQEARALDRRIVLLFLGAGLALVALLALTLVRVLRPVRALTGAAAALGGGDFAQRVVVRGDDELAQLSRAFNAMAERLERTERARRALVADVAHELRTPLTNLRCQVEAMEDGLAAIGPPAIRSLHDEVLLLVRLVDDLQVLALADAGELRLEPRRVELAPFLEQVVRAARPAFDVARLELRTDLAAATPAVLADEGRLGQVLRNLLENARAHTPAGGIVTIDARGAHGQVEIAVADTGPGIAPALLPRVFERGARGADSRSRANGGSGLGLAIVRSLVEAHGGRVDVQSAPGRGARFVLTLPAAP